MNENFSKIHIGVKPVQSIPSDKSPEKLLAPEPSRMITLVSRQSSTQSYPSPIYPNQSRSNLFSGFHNREKVKSDLVYIKKQELEKESFQRSVNLKASSHHKKIKSNEIFQNYLQEKISKAADSHRLLASNYKRAMQNEIAKKQKYLQKTNEKNMLKPQKIANMLNKPGVTTWMNLASGGRLRANSIDLPEPEGPNSLRNWELFSGYLGSTTPPKDQKDLNTRNTESRGFCYKLDPVYNDFTYDQAVHYLKLREKGLTKGLAARLSHKIHCNLHEKDVKFPKNYKENDRDFDQLVMRFELFTNRHPIREGEVVKDESFIESKFLKEIQSPKKMLERQSSVQMSPEFLKSPEPKNSENLGAGKRSKNAKSADSKKLSENEVKIMPSDRFTENIKETQDRPKQPAKKDIKPTSIPMSPYKYNHKIPVEASESGSVLNLKSSHQSPSKNLKKPELVRGKTIDSKISFIQDYLEKPKIYPEKAVSIDEVIKKKLEKKQQLTEENANSLKQILSKKLKKLRNIAETKKKIKEEHSKIIKINKDKFFEKVKTMKEKKELIQIISAEEISKKVQEKLFKAEKNKQKIQSERERKIEEQRQVYESQRGFVEYLRSLSLIEEQVN